MVKPRGVDLDVVKKIARTLPEVEEHTSARGTGFKVRGKILACEAVHASAEPGSLMVRIGSFERELLLGAEPETYYLTDHYRGYLVAPAGAAPTRGAAAETTGPAAGPAARR